MSLTLITLNYNNARATIDLLRSLERQTDNTFDVIVVDNNSTSADRALLGSYALSSTLRLEVLYSDYNRGFSGGNNLAIRKALAQGSEWLLLINNDTTVGPDFIATLHPQLPSTPSVLALPLHEGARTAYAGSVDWLYPTLPHVYHPITDTYRRSYYAVGAGMLVHRGIFEKIGLLDERYFLYFEDADFCMRAHDAHIPFHYLDVPVIAHDVSQTTRTLGSALLLRYHMRNSILFNSLHAPMWARIALPLWSFLTAAKQLLKLAARRSPLESRAILAGMMDAVRGRWGSISAVPVMAIECESLEDSSWGVARMIRGLLKELSTRDDIEKRLTIDLYFKGRVPDEPWLSHPLFQTHVVRSPSWLPLPISFSLYYYILLPLRLWLDSPSLTYWPNYMLPLIAPRPSVVMLTEDIWHQIHNHRLALRYRVAYALFSRFAARTATRIMAISHASRDMVHNLFSIPLSRIVTNELAVDAPLSTVEPMPGSYVLFIGQAFERRHLRETIRAFGMIAAKHPNLRFIAIGPDKYEPAIITDLLRTTNEALGRPAVQHIERVSDDDLARFYAGARVCVYVSDVEAFGLPPLEALSYGVPSVLADVPLNREIYGDDAFYAASRDVKGIAVALERALTDTNHRDAIKRQAQSIVTRYTWKAHADRMLNIVDDIITETT